MKRTLFISMLLCLFAIVANAQDLGIQGYYRHYGSTSGDIWYELKVGSDDPREYTEIGVIRGTTVEVQITEPATGVCTFSIDSGLAGCYILSSYTRCILIAVPDITPSGKDYSTLHITCGDKYLEVRMYII